GLRAYLARNTSGRLAAGEPNGPPSAQGVSRFTGRRRGTYAVRLVLGVDGLATTLRQTSPAGNGAVSVKVGDRPGDTTYGADFGVHVDVASGDFTSDGHPDLLVTDPATGDVYVPA